MKMLSFFFRKCRLKEVYVLVFVEKNVREMLEWGEKKRTGSPYTKIS